MRYLHQAQPFNTAPSEDFMNALVSLGNKILDFARAFSWFPPLLARLTVGWVFLQSGWGKAHNIDRVIGFFTSLGLPAPSFQAHLVAYTECIAGALLLIGLATRLASIPLIIIMTVALRTALAEDATSFSALTGISEYLYIVLLVWLMIAGPGKVSVDALIARAYRK
jgi:putative oxidoreductase